MFFGLPKSRQGWSCSHVAIAAFNSGAKHQQSEPEQQLRRQLSTVARGATSGKELFEGPGARSALQDGMAKKEGSGGEQVGGLLQ